MNKILIFGGSGRLGKNWIKILIKKNKVFANLHKKKIFIKNRNLRIIKLNIYDTKKLISFCIKNEISTIISTIALTDVDLCQKKKK